MHTQLVIIQPTSLCNINCRYCYLPNRAVKKRISPETLEQLFKVLFASPFLAENILFAWHAGEPLVLPIDFYELAFQLQERWNLKQVHITNAFQTNATLITQKWCKFFQKHNIKVGVSLDGPQQIHDTNRQDRAGKGTFERAMRGVALLRANNIAYSIISVITSASLHQPDQFWQVFSEQQPVRLGLNPEETEGTNISASFGTDADVQDYKHFLRRLLLLNEEHQDPLPLREF